MLVPMSALADLLIVVGFQSFKPQDVITVWQTGPAPRIAMVLTFVSTLVIPLQYAVFVGMVVSILLHVFKSSNKVSVVEFELVEEGFPIEHEPPTQLEPQQLIVLYVYGNIFFAAASAFEAQLLQVGDAQGATVVLILRGRDEIGSTFIGVLQRYNQTLQANGGALFLAGVAPHVRKQLLRTGVGQQIGEGHIFLQQPRLGEAMNAAIKAARQWLNSTNQMDGQ
jgi:SulP family sulfate permease